MPGDLRVAGHLQQYALKAKPLAALARATRLVEPRLAEA
jgi:hypothetical protein